MNIFITKYSEKAIIVTGDTKPIKDLLRSAGGSFNPRLTHPVTHQKIVGWVFSKARETELTRLLSGNDIKFDRVTPSDFNESTARDFIQDPAEIDADNFCQRNNI